MFCHEGLQTINLVVPVVLQADVGSSQGVTGLRCCFGEAGLDFNVIILVFGLLERLKSLGLVQESVKGFFRSSRFFQCS